MISRSDYNPLPSDIDSLFRPDLQRHVKPSSPDFAPSLRRLTLRYTCPLSTLYGLERSHPSLGTLSSLTVHVVGARTAESADVTSWECLAWRLPRLEALTVVLIGPELR